jgi:putative isomerase
MYKELSAMDYLAGCLNLPEIAEYYGREADLRMENIREHCWDRSGSMSIAWHSGD